MHALAILHTDHACRAHGGPVVKTLARPGTAPGELTCFCDTASDGCIIGLPTESLLNMFQPIPMHVLFLKHVACPQWVSGIARSPVHGNQHLLSGYPFPLRPPARVLRSRNPLNELIQLLPQGSVFQLARSQLVLSISSGGLSAPETCRCLDQFLSFQCCGVRNVSSPRILTYVMRCRT